MIAGFITGVLLTLLAVWLVNLLRTPNGAVIEIYPNDNTANPRYYWKLVYKGVTYARNTGSFATRLGAELNIIRARRLMSKATLRCTSKCSRID